jgi:uncharacterized membrane protein
MANQVTKSIIVSGTVDDIYNLWANFENFPYFMKDIKTVKKTGERTSHWTMEGPLHTTLEWNAETTRLEKNKRIAWSSKGDDGDVTTSGQVTFTGLPQNQTEVTVTLQYTPSKGMAGDTVAKLFADLEGRLEEDLRNFKAYAEGMPERVNS